MNLGAAGTFAVGASQTISALNSSIPGAGTLTLGSGTALTVGSSDNLPSNFSGTIGGSGTLIKAGGGIATIGGQSAYGGTTVSSGLLIAANNGALGASPVTLSGGILRFTPASIASTFGGTSTSVTGAGTGWTVNNNTITSNPINANALTVTDGGAGEGRAAWLNTPLQFQNGFTATFDYTETTPASNPPADGFAFVLQKASSGTAALGATGGNLGYSGITPSVALELNIYPNNNPGTAATPAGAASFQTNGAIETAANSALVNNVANHDTWQVAVTYNASTTQLTAVFSDLTNPSVASTTIGPTTENLASILGSTTAYIGFTGGTGGADATQKITNFYDTYVNTSSSYANGVILTGGASSTIDIAAVAGASTISAGTLTVGSGGGTTLNLTASTAPVAQSYGLTLGSVSLGGNVTFNVANNTNGGNALGTLTLGALTTAARPAL